MTPASGGRHCAACQKTVVDFTQKTDAEILVILARAGGGETCGRFGADQLNRPLLPVVGATPRSGWQAWVAMALAAWGLRAGPAAAASTRALNPPSTLHPVKKAVPARPTGKRLRGVVCDAATHRGIADVAVFLKGENRMAMTDSEGHFSLPLPAKQARNRHTLVMHRTGYRSQTMHVPATGAMPLVRVGLHDDVREVVVVAPYRREERQMVSGSVSNVMAAEELAAPAPRLSGGRGGSFFRWLTKPFRREQKLRD